MREKPVPLRVGKDLQPLQGETAMNTEEKDDNYEKETSESISENISSKELPSMVSIHLPLNSRSGSPSANHETRLYQTGFEYRPLDIPGEFDFLNKDSVSESQKQAVKFGVRVFRDWLYKQGVQFQAIEDMSRGEMAKALGQFYLTARRPNGTQYKKNTLKSIKHSLDHYLRCSPFRKEYSISSDYDFRQVNKTLDNLPEDADQNRFPQFTKATILKLYKSGQLGLTTTDDPNIIIQTVWFYIVSYFFTNIDKRMLRELKESNLILGKDEQGREYYCLEYKPPDKVRGDVEKSRIYARPGSLCCPVAIIKKYMAHRNPRNDVLFQHPKRISHTIWYSPLPLGKNKHTDLMKSMCLNAGVDPPLTGRCIRGYVQDLLQECDQDVNELFRLEGPPSMHGILKFPVDPDQHVASPFVLSVPRLPSTMLNTTKRNNQVNIQPRSTSGHLATLTINETTNHCKADVSTQHDGHLQDNHVNTNADKRIVLPYPNNFSTINDFAKPKHSYNCDAYLDPSYHNGIGSRLTTGTFTTTTRDIQPTNRSTKRPCTAVRAATTEAWTQTELLNKEWLESAYYKADLKTRNKMRLQARKCLLSLLEELNEISDGHGTELFHEIVQEDTNMWKSITKPCTLK